MRPWLCLKEKKNRNKLFFSWHLASYTIQCCVFLEEMFQFLSQKICQHCHVWRLIHCQIAEIQNRYGNPSLGGSRREFPEIFSWSGKAHPDRVAPCLLDWEKRREWARSTSNAALCSLTVDTMGPLTSRPFLLDFITIAYHILKCDLK